MKVLIVEDESAASRRLEKLIHEIDPSIQVVEILDSIESTVNWWEHNSAPDMILLDIHLADGSSFEIFNFVEIKSPIIFTTAYDQYAIQAFRVNTVDYLLKPIKKMELERAIKKYRGQQPMALDYKALASALRRDDYNKRFLIRFGQQIRVVETKEVAYFYTQDKVTFLVTFEGKRYPIDTSLEKLEEEIDALRFFRINRQFIVSLESIGEMYAYSKSRVKIDLKPTSEVETIVSTDRSPVFKKWLVGGE